MLSAMGYFGTMTPSRGMLLVFQWPVLLWSSSCSGSASLVPPVVDHYFLIF